MTNKELLPFPAVFWVFMEFSFVAARSMPAGFERINREVQVLLHPMNRPVDLKKEKREELWVTSPDLSGYNQHTSTLRKLPYLLV